MKTLYFSFTVFQVPTLCGHLLFSGPHFVRYTKSHTYACKHRQSGTSHWFYTQKKTGDSTPTGDYCPSIVKVPGLKAYTITHAPHKPGPHAWFPIIWQSNGLVLVQDVARYLATIIPHCMNHRTLAGTFTT